MTVAELIAGMVAADHDTTLCLMIEHFGIAAESADASDHDRKIYAERVAAIQWARATINDLRREVGAYE